MNAWPELPLEAWKETYATLHMWSQVVGKVRMAKSPPVNHWWHVPLDLTTTDGETRSIPLRPMTVADSVTREGYSHECWSAGWWPGAGLGEPTFYAYAYPTPDGYSASPVEPAEARWEDALGEFVLPYDAVRTAPDPDAALLAFLRTTYAAAADAGGWDREALERPRS